MPKPNAMEELIGEAVAATEQEIWDDALSQDPDENTGDRSLEEIEDEDGVPADGDEEPESEEEPEGDEEAEGEEGDEHPDRAVPDDREGRIQARIPPARLREEAEARRAAEAERDVQAQRLRALEAEIQLLKRGPQERRPEPEKPDLFADPEAWARQQRAEIRQELVQGQMAGSFEETVAQHGDAFHTAYVHLLRGCQSGDPSALAAAQRIGTSPSRAGAAIMGWHLEQQMLHEIGGDPAAYEQRVAERLLEDPDYRRELTARLAGDARNAGRTRVERQIDRGRAETDRSSFDQRSSSGRRLPPSLSSASGGRSHRSGDPGPRTTRSTESEIFDSVWEN
jgi:hypothetical protein